MRELILGGVRSGKIRLAERLASGNGLAATADHRVADTRRCRES